MNTKSHLTFPYASAPLRIVGLSAALAASLAMAATAQDASSLTEGAANVVSEATDAVKETTTDAVDAATDAVAGVLSTDNADPAAETEAESSSTQASPALSTGTPVEDNIGRTYTLEEHGDWEIRCIKAPEGSIDPCNMYQLLQDSEGNDVAEFTLFHYGQGEVDAGATIVTPLETLLTEQLTVTVDGANGRRYPYSFCNPIGCYARLGMTKTDLGAFQRGAKAVVTLVPSSAPNQKVNLDVSLAGFTAGYARVTELNLEARSAAQ